MSKLVVHFELLKNTTIFRVQNEYVDYFTIFGLIFVKLEENVSNKIPNKYDDLLPKQVVMIIPSTFSTRKHFHRQNKNNTNVIIILYNFYRGINRSSLKKYLVKLVLAVNRLVY